MVASSLKFSGKVFVTRLFDQKPDFYKNATNGWGCVPHSLSVTLSAKKRISLKSLGHLTSFAEFFKQCRLEKGLLQEDVAKMLDVSVGTIGNWETERGFPNKHVIPKVEEFLGEKYAFELSDKRLRRLIMRYRRKQKLTVKEMAGKLDLYWKTVANLEKREHPFKGKTRTKMTAFIKEYNLQD